MKTNYFIFLSLFALLIFVVAIESFKDENQQLDEIESIDDFHAYLEGGGGTEINGRRRMKHYSGKGKKEKQDKYIPDGGKGEGKEEGKKKYNKGKGEGKKKPQTFLDIKIKD
uniref:Glycine-rich protein n=1 Tax=Ononis spinosa TaxID=58890 RepID=A0A411AFI7_ONOSP|nr:glycine-rich protein [Ononis spinosa]